DQVAHLDVYQRTPIWVAPKPDHRIGVVERAVLAVPPLRSAARAAGTVTFDVLGNVSFQQRLRPLRAVGEGGIRSRMRRQVDDPETREALIPDYSFGCKRPSMSNAYLRTFNRDHVDLVTTPISSITATGVRTADGEVHEAEVLICATGFRIMSEAEPFPF